MKARKLVINWRRTSFWMVLLVFAVLAGCGGGGSGSSPSPDVSPQAVELEVNGESIDVLSKMSVRGSVERRGEGVFFKLTKDEIIRLRGLVNGGASEHLTEDDVDVLRKILLVYDTKMQTCLDGSVIPATDTCPVVMQTCPMEV